jgi:hypothetical protein
MHILEQYAINCGAKINKPYILEEFYPIPFQEDYICIHSGSGMDSKNYDHFQEVIDLISPLLHKNKIKIIQIGGSKEKLLEGCFDARGSSKRQMAYILSKSKLYFGNDTMSLHFASYFQKKIVCVSTVLYSSNFYPYWSNQKDYTIIESHRDGKKPTFSAKEDPKTINFINPEIIAIEILNKLDIKNNLNKLKTIFIGDFYNNKIFNVVPDHLVQRNQTINHIISRMDLLHNEEVLNKQLQIIKCVITCSEPISAEILKNNKENILGVNCFVENESNLDFVKTLKALNIKYQLFSYLREEELNKHKLHFMDYGNIIRINLDHPKIKEKITTFKDKNLSIFYKSKNFILSKGKVFLSEKAFFDNKPVDSLNDNIQEYYDMDIINENPDKFYIFGLELTKV